MRSTNIASVLCIIYFVVLNEKLSLAEHSTAIGKRHVSEVSALAPSGGSSQAVIAPSNLRRIQATVQDLVGGIGDTVTSLLTGLRNLIETAANTYTAAVNGILALASTANTADNDCILNDTPLANITLSFESDLGGCVGDIVDRITDLGNRANEIAWTLNDLIRRTELAIGSCIGGNLITGTLCVTGYLPDLIFSTLSLLSDAISAALDLLTILPVIIVRLIICVVESIGNRLGQVVSVGISRITCVANNFSPTGPD